MKPYRHSIGSRTYHFSDLKDLMAKASPMKSGDALAGVAAAIASQLNARLSIILIGERPGLSAADSMGIYLTHAPIIGRTDAQRNCISNIRQTGLSPEKASRQLQILISEAFKLGLSGVNLKIKNQIANVV